MFTLGEMQLFIGDKGDESTSSNPIFLVIEVIYIIPNSCTKSRISSCPSQELTTHEEGFSVSGSLFCTKVYAGCSGFDHPLILSPFSVGNFRRRAIKMLLDLDIKLSINREMVDRREEKRDVNMDFESNAN